ncbi:peptidyl-prolyl cis-trans isomerase [Rhizobium tibeticum]|uniref:Parvulin-like PPIase n=1 Tax=Rhizobium tibeticum TaxID=501024 RepID=A0A1K0JF07_9HYPH|nr:peptidylprolyl isomerase [Rhizobium tibeticum]SEH97320.1 peptidylprolyl isomerase [Rhizobium tibeticum]
MKLFPIAPETSGVRAGEESTKSRWRRAIGEPLLHFLVVGGFLFGVYHLLTPPQGEGEANTNQIVLTKDDVRQLAISWLAQGRSSPTTEQIRGLVDQKVNQEILFREAVALGLDRDDEVVKRRLAQKMDFLATDVASLQEPTDAELKTWFDKNSATFALPAHATFRHLYFSTDRHGKETKEVAAAALAFVEGKSPDSSEIAAIGDPFMFQNHYGDATPAQMSKEFGREFSNVLFQLAQGKWVGPVKSGYGWHLVWIDSIEPGRIPIYAEVMPNVKAGWIDDKYREIKTTALEEMRSRYSVIVPPIEAADFQDLQVPPGFNLGLEVSAQ